jgi:hypothetical protein
MLYCGLGTPRSNPGRTRICDKLLPGNRRLRNAGENAGGGSPIAVRSFVRSHHCHSSNLKSAATPGIPKSFPTTAFRYPGADAAALPREYLRTNWS